MKKALAAIVQIFSGPKGELSSKRILAGGLIMSGIILAFLNGNPNNVQTLVFGGCGLLGAGAFAERFNVPGLRKNEKDAED